MGPGLRSSFATYATHAIPGRTLYFQFTYRNVNGPCHSGTNTTNGLEVQLAL